MENKYVRVVTCSLLAVRKLLQNLSAEQTAALYEQLTVIMEDPKFWKHGKHKVNMVWYSKLEIRGLIGNNQ